MLTRASPAVSIARLPRSWPSGFGWRPYAPTATSPGVDAAGSRRHAVGADKPPRWSRGMRRREFLGLAGATLVAGVSTRAASQVANWPERPVKLILPYAPGGASDLIGRPWADKLSQAFGQQFVIENRGGASGIIGTEAVARSAPDGYTFLLTPSAPLTVQPALRKTPYDPAKSFTPVGRVGDLISGFAIHPAVGLKTFKEMIDYAKAN